MIESNDCLTGQSMYDLCVKLFPICRSITGNGVRKTLNILNSVIGGGDGCARNSFGDKSV